MKLALIIILTAILSGVALSHDSQGDSNWISKKPYHSPVDGSHCCSKDDCTIVDVAIIQEKGGGYEVRGPVVYYKHQLMGSPGNYFWVGKPYLIDVDEVVPYNQVQVSEDGNYWRCKRANGERRCFFAPPTSI